MGKDPVKHVVTRHGTHIFRIGLPMLVFMGAFLTGCSVLIIGLSIAGWQNGTITGDPFSPGNLALLIGLGAVLLGLMLLGVRVPFMSVRVRDGRLTVRNFVRTYRFSTGAVTRIELEVRSAHQEADRWIPRVYLVDGRRVELGSFPCGPASKDPDPAAILVLDELRELIGPQAAAEAGQEADEATGGTERRERELAARLRKRIDGLITLVLILICAWYGGSADGGSHFINRPLWQNSILWPVAVIGVAILAADGSGKNKPMVSRWVARQLIARQERQRIMP